MTLRRVSLFAIVVGLVGCRDFMAPPTGPATARAPRSASADWAYQPSTPVDVHMLRQSQTAPLLETYEASFWAVDGEASGVTVNYLPAAGEVVGQPFLRFDIPKNALATRPGGDRMHRGDSVLVTVTIDPVTFAVAFQPSGVWFSNGTPAQLTIWYENADPDYNGDGVVDDVDQLLQQQIAVWCHGRTYWVPMNSANDPTLPSVSTALYHFSEYAVSW